MWEFIRSPNSAAGWQDSKRSQPWLWVSWRHYARPTPQLRHWEERGGGGEGGGTVGERSYERDSQHNSPEQEQTAAKNTRGKFLSTILCAVSDAFADGKTHVTRSAASLPWKYLLWSNVGTSHYVKKWFKHSKYCWEKLFLNLLKKAMLNCRVEACTVMRTSRLC